ncbi:MAG: M48 family metalloprotease [Gemmatimonas sp.]|nr:M48 family metalloprotease [Gemmatimonas sp.]
MHLVAVPPRIRLLCLTLVVLAGCARNPVTGGLQLALITEGQEIQMGQQAAQEVSSTIGLVDDPALQDYVSDLGLRLAASSERPELPWAFAVVDDATPNAFALPGGPIFITRGLMDLMRSEAQLATVLGHEIGHVTARHHVTSLSRTQLAQIGLGVGGILFPDLQQLGNVASAGLQLLFLSHGRDAERQADDLGFRYALDQSFDVREMGLVFESLERFGEPSNQSPVPSWLLTHPAPDERIQSVGQRLEALANPLGQLRIGEQAYLDRIDGLTYGPNPRNGFFREGLFLHPDLRFQIAFPAGWQTQNLSQTVTALSPQQNAVIQLTLSADSDPEAAARSALNQPGIQVGQTSREPVNGLPAVLATFRAQTQQGTVDGVMAFIAYDGRVYQMMGYGPAGSFASEARSVQESLVTFRELTDPDALDTQPNRIAIVRTTETMTLAEFDDRFPSVIPIEELAVINQVEGPSILLPAGSLVKRVVES